MRWQTSCFVVVSRYRIDQQGRQSCGCPGIHHQFTSEIEHLANIQRISAQSRSSHYCWVVRPYYRWCSTATDDPPDRTKTKPPSQHLLKQKCTLTVYLQKIAPLMLSCNSVITLFYCLLPTRKSVQKLFSLPVFMTAILSFGCRTMSAVSCMSWA